MLKIVKGYTAEIEYTGKRYVPFNVNGKDCNGGDMAEIAVKSAYNLPAVKDGNGAFDVTDDIPEFNASVKSGAATLVNRVLGNNFDEIVTAYMENTHSKNVWYAIPDIEKKCVAIYQMTLAEFEKYLKLFARFDPDRKVIRLRKDSAKNQAWLDMMARG